jgi:predicted metal-dependent peptidase
VALDRTRIAAARLWSVTQLPYLASALFATSVHEAPGIGTIAIDKSWRIHADGDLIGQLEPEEIGKIFVHLIGHLLREHADRGADLDLSADEARKQWNLATDAEINDDLAIANLVPAAIGTVPSDLGCADQQLAEHYFTHVPKGLPRWDCGSGSDGVTRRWDGEGAEGITLPQSELLKLAVAAEIHRHHAEQPGSVPGGWLRWAEHILPSRIDWRRVLAAEIRSGVASVAGMVDYTYRRPSRRQQSVSNVLLPTLIRPVPVVAVVCDTSGSMHEALLERALAEVEGLLAKAGLRQAQVHVLACDTNVHAVRRVSSARDVVLAGGGGTDMGAGLHRAGGLRPRPSVIIVLTDGFTPWPTHPPKGSKVVVGLLSQPGLHIHLPPVPDWARKVVIDQA